MGFRSISGWKLLKKANSCGETFKLKFINVTIKPKVKFASSYRYTDRSARFAVSNLRCRLPRARDSVRHKAVSFNRIFHQLIFGKKHNTIRHRDKVVPR